MKLTSLFILVILCAANSPVRAQRIALPAECAKILDRRDNGWEFAEIRDEIMQWFQTSGQPYRPNLIMGDWDGDGRTDYAALIKTAGSRAETGSYVLAVFMKKARGYSLYRLEPNDYLVLIKKGERDYDFATGRNFTYKNDAIFTGIFEKAGSSYVWRKGRFVAILTSD
jgi:hypothetical protein